jgi:hypothetical protein
MVSDFISLIIASIAVIILLVVLIPCYLIPLLEIISLLWKDRRSVLEWSSEKKISWAFVIINPCYSYFINKESLGLSIFFHLIWILLLYVAMGFYLREFECNQFKSKELYKRQKEKTVFFVVVIIFESVS